MAKRIERFEDFIAWQKARKLTADIYRVTSEGSFARDFGLKNQIRRAAVSSMSNLAEGFERGRPAEFHQFLSIAKASCSSRLIPQVEAHSSAAFPIAFPLYASVKPSFAKPSINCTSPYLLPQRNIGE